MWFAKGAVRLESTFPHKIVLLQSYHQRKQDALGHTLTALQITYACDAIVSLLGGVVVYVWAAQARRNGSGWTGWTSQVEKSTPSSILASVWASKRASPPLSPSKQLVSVVSSTVVCITLQHTLPPPFPAWISSLLKKGWKSTNTSVAKRRKKQERRSTSGESCAECGPQLLYLWAHTLNVTYTMCSAAEVLSLQLLCSLSVDHACLYVCMYVSTYIYTVHIYCMCTCISQLAANVLIYHPPLCLTHCSCHLLQQWASWQWWQRSWET